MPEGIIFPASSVTNRAIAKPTASFTGEVYLDLIKLDPSVVIANVTFTPCARTHWHTHEGGQVIRVLSGSGWICDKGKEAQRIKAGDIIWAPPGTTHWHGADNGSVMTHFAAGIGQMTQHEAVTDEEYQKRAEA
ncbi:hypothetical protein HFD88_010685 [Aspergillus terreus]|nr:hypothetical protein HFD88_010685 [Aspergillus terreus]